MSVNKPQSAPSAEDQTNAAADRAAEAADHMVSTTRRVANDALDHVESAIHSARANVQPAISRIATQAETLARKGLDAVKDGAYQVRDRAQTLGDVTVRYVKDEPVKAVLIAAATGAALMALLSLVQSARRNSDR
ncbi:hypothetical protein [Rhizobacter sp. Root1221]|uniref:hypothetical protein n=1 Tax=Rhizobacter sp. Root1221 TaxID=1736433 RepID=UPI0006F5E08E|nr:hypothetical protein [Rhizobacter sp. Root1221]KQV78745.1 hypothetical protein ASC87_10390 [Rhizobacter sp. Root1221]